MNVFGSLISLEIRPGRLRRLERGALLALTAAGAWGWFGMAGLVPAVICWWACCGTGPDGPARRRVCRVIFSSADLRFAHLGWMRVCFGLGGLRRVEIFRDELAPADYAALRRMLKAAVSARHGLEDVQPV